MLTSAGAYLGRRPRAFRRRTCVGIHAGATTCLYHANANSTARDDVCGAWTDLCVGRSTRRSSCAGWASGTARRGEGDVLAGAAGRAGVGGGVVADDASALARRHRECPSWVEQTRHSYPATSDVQDKHHGLERSESSPGCFHFVTSV